MKDGEAADQKRGAALVTTVIVIAVLAVVMVAFSQTATTERFTTRIVSDYLQAQLAAEAGAESALASLWQTTLDGPYATIYARNPASTVPSPYLFFAKRQLNEGIVATRRYPLFSSAFTTESYFDSANASLIDTNARTLNDEIQGESVSRNITDPTDLAVDINRVWQVMTNGLVGLTTNGTRLAIPVNWIYLSNNAGKIVGRFAYWTDDECSKLDVGIAGNNTNGPWNSALPRSYGTNLGEVSLSFLTNSSPGGVGVSGGLLSKSQVDNLLAFKRTASTLGDKSLLRFPLVEGAAPINDSDVWNRLRPYITTAAYHDRRAPDGKLKLNLNTVIAAAPTDAARIQQEMDSITEAITNNLPEFGARSASDATGDDREFYVRKIAANIRDFVDADNAATVVTAFGATSVATNVLSVRSLMPFGNSLTLHDIPAVGKDGAPVLSEYLCVITAQNPAAGAGGTVSLNAKFAHYVELHNPTGRTVRYSDLNDPYILLTQRERWTERKPSAGGWMDIPLRPPDLVMRLPSSFEIPPNGYAVVTTDSTPIAIAAGTVYGLTRGTGPGTWDTFDPGGASIPMAGVDEVYQLTTQEITVSGNPRYNVFTSKSSAMPYADAEERLVFASSAGVYDIAPKIYTADRLFIGRGADNPVYNWTFPADPVTFSRNTSGDADTEARFSRGDLLANMEISSLANNTGGTWRTTAAGGAVYQSKFNANSNSLTLGSLNFNYSDRGFATGVSRWRRGWKEYTSDPAGNHFVANRPLFSVGELGFVYDPSRHSLAGYRSHGATLRLGQSDAGTNNRAGNGTGEYANWLGGRGSDFVTNTNYLRNAFLLADIFTTSTNDRGRVNPNSLVRDGGFVFRALTEGFVFETNPASGASAALGGKTINSNALLPNLLATATNAAGLVSLGDVSLASAFHAGTNLVAGVDMTNTTTPVSDAGKEEFFRRSANLLTTQSLGFTVFSIGQSGRFVGDRFQVSSTAVKELLVHLAPTYPEATSDFERVAPQRWNFVKLREMNY
ncbi:MAG: hypothetical protein FGM15_01270 [Chthoniobacterales bacterium]|nr:hypothetical protein [Chthoniobacterales bacterium]